MTSANELNETDFARAERYRRERNILSRENNELKSQHEKDRAEIVALKMALENRDEVHADHVRSVEAMRMREIGEKNEQIGRLKELVDQAENLLVSSLESAISDLRNRRYNETDIASFEESFAEFNRLKKATREVTND